MRNKLLRLVLILIFVSLLAGCRDESGQITGTDNNGGKLNTVDDIKDKRIGVLLGSVHDDYANKTYPDATIMQYKSQSDLILAVKAGKVDAAFFSHEALLEVLRGVVPGVLTQRRYEYE